MAPDLTLTMLGTTKSGKSTFLLGMYDTLSTGLHGYFTYTEDPDQGVDLRDAWDLLIDQGELPKPNDVDQSKYYRFRFCRGFKPLVTIDWMDYRGGALDDRSDSGADVSELRERLTRSDSIYLVMDGGSLAEWLDNPSARTVVQRKLKVQAMSSRVLEAVSARQEQELPAPSLAVVITKSDLLRGPGRTVGEALAQVVEGLPKLLPVVWSEGVTALVCPVKVGDFGSSSTGVVDVSTIDPVSLHRPMVFSLMHYLAEGLGAREARVAEAAASRSEVEEQLVELNRGFLAIFRGRRASRMRDLADTYANTIDGERRQAQSDRTLIEQLGEELTGHPMIRDGKLEL
jgi:hypothetical protein